METCAAGREGIWEPVPAGTGSVFENRELLKRKRLVFSFMKEENLSIHRTICGLYIDKLYKL